MQNEGVGIPSNAEFSHETKNGIAMQKTKKKEVLSAKGYAEIEKARPSYGKFYENFLEEMAAACSLPKIGDMVIVKEIETYNRGTKKGGELVNCRWVVPSWARTDSEISRFMVVDFLPKQPSKRYSSQSKILLLRVWPESDFHKIDTIQTNLVRIGNIKLIPAEKDGAFDPKNYDPQEYISH